MKFGLQFPVESLSGRNGLITFSSNASGAYVKKFVKPANPQTTRQVNARNIMTSIANAWYALTVTNREDWNYFANNGFLPLGGGGVVTSYSGRSAYNSCKTVESSTNNFDTFMKYTPWMAAGTTYQAYTSTNISVPSGMPGGLSVDNQIYIKDGVTQQARTYTLSLEWNTAVGTDKGVYAVITTDSNFTLTSGSVFEIGFGNATAGLNLYLSEPLQVEGAAYFKLFNRLIVSTGTTVTGTWAGTTYTGTSLKIGHKYLTGFLSPGGAGWYATQMIAKSGEGELRTMEGGNYVEPTISA